MKSFYNLLFETGIVAVIRATDENQGYEIAKACYLGGIRFLEITFTVPNADRLIQRLSHDLMFRDAIIGAGSVIDLETAKKAIDSNSRFIVGPNFDEEIANLCNRSLIPYMPGCMTINEMIYAKKFGVEVIKLFPGAVFGPQYVKAIKGPIPGINIMPTGGVTLENLQAWVNAGIVAVGVGSELTAPAKTGDYHKIQTRATDFTNAFLKALKERKN